MSFEDELRVRLRDLADVEDDWADPLPAALQQATVVTPLARPAPPSRIRRRLPTLAVAAVLVAGVIGVGFGVAALGDGGSSSAGSAAGVAAPGDATTGPPPAEVSTPGSGSTLPTCGSAPTTTGPLATLATATVAPAPDAGEGGGSTPLDVTLTFTGSGPTVQARAPQVYALADGRIVGRPGGASSFLVQDIPVTPGSVRDSATFTAVDCSGKPLPAGTYQLVVVYSYSVGSGGSMDTLVSAPVTGTVR